MNRLKFLNLNQFSRNRFSYSIFKNNFRYNNNYKRLFSSSRISDTPLDPRNHSEKKNDKNLEIDGNHQVKPKKRPGFFKNPLAWTIHTVADITDVGKDVVVETVKTGGKVASSIVNTASDVVTPNLPKVYDGKLPKFVHELTDVSESVSSSATGFVGDGIKIVQQSGAIVGRAVGDNVASLTTRPINKKYLPHPNDIAKDSNTTILLKNDENSKENSNGVEEEEEEEEDFLSETTDALKRLLSSGATAANESINALETATEDILSSSSNAGIRIVSHTLGEDSGNLARKGVGVGRTTLKTVKTVKTFGWRKALQIASKTAQKEALKSFVTQPTMIADLPKQSRVVQQASHTLDDAVPPTLQQSQALDQAVPNLNIEVKKTTDENKKQ